MNAQEEGSNTRKLSATVSGRMAASKLFVLVATVTALAAIGADLLRPKQTFYVVAPNGGKTEVFPLTEPNVTPSSLINWVTQAATSAYTLDFYHYQDNIDSLQQYFTIEGYKNYIASINGSGTLNKIITEHLVVSAVAIDTAVILQEGMMNDVYSWKIQIPLLLTYQGASTNTTQKTIVANMLVTREPTNIAPKGIGIAQIVDEEYHAQS